MILILSTYFPDLPTFTKLKAKAVGSAASVVLREAKGKMVRGMHLGHDFGAISWKFPAVQSKGSEKLSAF